MDDSRKIDRYEDELRQLIQRMHNESIREEVIHFILDQAARDSELKIVSKGELD